MGAQKDERKNKQAAKPSAGVKESAEEQEET
jgi:hypothetical protein